MIVSSQLEIGLSPAFGDTRLSLDLTNDTIDSSAVPGDLVGMLKLNSAAARTSAVFTLIDNAGGRFALSGSRLVVGASALSHAAATPKVTVEASDGAETIRRSFAVKLRQPLPKSAASLTLASNRVSFPNIGVAATASDASALGHTFHVAPEYGIAGGMRLLFCNFWIAGDGSANPERKPGTAKTIDFATVFVGANAYPVRFGGAESAVIADGGFVWSDVVKAGSADLTIPARQAYYVRVSETTPAGATRVLGLGSQLQIPRWSNWSTGEGVQFSSTPQTARKTSGTVPAFSGGSQPVGPHMIVAKGWNGSAVYALFGDSIGATQSDGGTNIDDRGVLGHIGRALDDIGSGRRSFANFCVPGTKPQDQAGDADGQFKLRLAALRALPNLPFNKVISRMGQNGIFPLVANAFTEFGAGQPNNVQNAMRKWWTFLHGAFGTDIYQLTVTPRAQDSAFTYAYWTDPAVQRPTDPSVDGSPAGSRLRFNEWLLDPANHPAYVKVLDDRAAFYDTAVPFAWRKVAAGPWTLSAEAASGAGTGTPVVMTGAAPPPLGDWYVIEPRTANAELRRSYRITGSGPWSVYFESNTARTHPAGSEVMIASTGDGLHPGHSLHLAGAALLIALKRDGTLP